MTEKELEYRIKLRTKFIDGGTLSSFKKKCFFCKNKNYIRIFTNKQGKIRMCFDCFAKKEEK